MNEERDTDERLWHPWLRINRILRVMLQKRRGAEAWPQVKAEFEKALALRSQIRRAGWFNYARDRQPSSTEVPMRLIGLVILSVGLTPAPLAGDAQQAVKIPKIGWLSDGVRSDRSDLQGAFVEGLWDLGCEEGRNVVIERRDAGGRPGRR